MNQIQTFKFDSPLLAMKTIAQLLAAQIQFTCTHEAGQIHVCYPIGAEATLPVAYDRAWEQVFSVLHNAQQGAIL
ncbi:hypothetical protein [Stenotrophomonas pavanii]|uniref:hypothetical protein n=1 Tax=Stenotrophomonas pavanii TaxID=487698 RepID=UPI0039C6FDB6